MWHGGNIAQIHLTREGKGKFRGRFWGGKWREVSLKRRLHISESGRGNTRMAMRPGLHEETLEKDPFRVLPGFGDAKLTVTSPTQEERQSLGVHELGSRRSEL